MWTAYRVYRSRYRSTSTRNASTSPRNTRATITASELPSTEDRPRVVGDSHIKGPQLVHVDLSSLRARAGSTLRGGPGGIPLRLIKAQTARCGLEKDLRGLESTH